MGAFKKLLNLAMAALSAKGDEGIARAVHAAIFAEDGAALARACDGAARGKGRDDLRKGWIVASPSECGAAQAVGDEVNQEGVGETVGRASALVESFAGLAILAKGFKLGLIDRVNLLGAIQGLSDRPPRLREIENAKRMGEDVEALGKAFPAAWLRLDEEWHAKGQALDPLQIRARSEALRDCVGGVGRSLSLMADALGGSASAGAALLERHKSGLLALDPSQWEALMRARRVNSTGREEPDAFQSWIEARELRGALGAAQPSKRSKSL